MASLTAAHDASPGRSAADARGSLTWTAPGWYACPVLEAGLWAAVGQASLVVGALLVHRIPRLTEPWILGLVMAFGAGHAHQRDHDRPRRRGVRRGGLGCRPGLGLLRRAPPATTALTEWLDRRAEREDPEEPVEEAEDAGGPDALPAAADATAGAQPHASGWCSTASPSRSRSGSRSSVSGERLDRARRCRLRRRGSPKRSAVAAAMLAGGRSRSDECCFRFGAIVAVGFGRRRWTGTRCSNTSENDLDRGHPVRSPRER